MGISAKSNTYYIDNIEEMNILRAPKIILNFGITIISFADFSRRAVIQSNSQTLKLKEHNNNIKPLVEFELIFLQINVFFMFCLPFFPFVNYFY